MNFSNGVNMPSYVVYRDSPAGQPFDATAPLAFFPPKDSDELFDALRAEFPHLKTHSERMREATIAYLIQERQDEQSPIPVSAPMTTETASTSPWLTSFPSMSTDSSSFSSPDMLGLATPSFGNSPQSQPAQMSVSRQQSVAGAASTPRDGATPPALEQMTGVFSLSDSTQPKQRVRRKMTEAEKMEYRKRRIVKACDKCSKRKRKCNHNQPEMESLSKPSQKVEKTKPAAHHKKSAVIPMSLSPDPAPEPTDQPFIQGDDWFDFTLMDPMPNMTFDDLLQSDLDKPLETQQYVRNQWPWGDDPDFTAMMSDEFALQSEDLSFYNGQDLRDGPLFDHTHADASTVAFTTGNKKYPVGVQPQQQTRGGASGNGMLWSDLDTQEQQLLEQQSRQSSHGGASGNRMLWEHLRTGQQQAVGIPTLQRESHLQNVESGDAVLFDGHFGDNVGEFSSYSGGTAPRKELTRNLKNPIAGDVQHDLDADDHSMHQSEATTKTRRDRLLQANEQNRAGVRSVEGTGTKDILQSATRPQQQGAFKKNASQVGTAAASLQANNAGRTVDASAEMFRLRHRVPGTVQTVQPSSRTHPETQQAMAKDSTQVKGGAYLQLVAGNGATMAPSLTGLTAILPATGAEKSARTRTRNANAGINGPLDANQQIETGVFVTHPVAVADKPVHTRSRNPSSSSGNSLDTDQRSTSLPAIHSTAGADKPVHTRSRNPSKSSGNNLETDQRSESGTHAESTSIVGLHHSSRPRAHGRSPLQVAPTAQSVTATADSSSDFYQERLHDTVRHRDHFGRLALSICSAILGTLLLFCAVQNALSISLSMLVPALSISPSTLLLALFAPSCLCAKESHAKFQTMYEEDASLDLGCGGRSSTMICRDIGSGRKLLGAISGASKASGWIMTPHSSLKWAVQHA